MSDFPDNQKFLTPRELSQLIKRSEQTLANDRFRKRGLPYFRFGRQIRYGMTDVIQAANVGRVIPGEGSNV